MSNDDGKTIIWMNENRQDIDFQIRVLEDRGHNVQLGQSFLQLHELLMEAIANGPNTLRAVILNMMAEDAGYLPEYYPELFAHPKVRSVSLTYGAGLLYLERVLLEDSRFGALQDVPVILNSSRPLTDEEVHKISAANARGWNVRFVGKFDAFELVDVVRNLPPRQT